MVIDISLLQVLICCAFLPMPGFSETTFSSYISSFCHVPYAVCFISIELEQRALFFNVNH